LEYLLNSLTILSRQNRTAPTDLLPGRNHYKFLTGQPHLKAPCGIWPNRLESFDLCHEITHRWAVFMMGVSSFIPAIHEELALPHFIREHNECRKWKSAGFLFVRFVNAWASVVTLCTSGLIHMKCQPDAWVVFGSSRKIRFTRGLRPVVRLTKRDRIRLNER
jgi:hypothetical protein